VRKGEEEKRSKGEREQRKKGESNVIKVRSPLLPCSPAPLLSYDSTSVRNGG
jgi:hypothetical protein